jgi:GR25 family glycosyltransferase involved in LPS biosynthesis
MISPFLINLDRDPQRLAWSKKQLEAVGLEFTRVSAVDMNQLPETDRDLVTLGVKACWESHKKTLQLFLEGNSNFALIAEDDLYFRNHRKVRRVLRSAQWQDLDVFQIGFLSHGFLSKTSIAISNLEAFVFKILSIFIDKFGANSRVGNRMRVKQAHRMPFGMVAARFEAGTHCYIISRHAAETVLNLNNPQFLSADDFYSALARMRSLKFGRPSRSLASQKNFPKFPGPRFRLDD